MTQAALLWISLAVLTFVTGGMAAVQHVRETKERVQQERVQWTAWEYARLGIRAVGASSLFLVVSFLTPPSPTCLTPQSEVPQNAAWITALLFGALFSLFALVWPEPQVDTADSGPA